MDADARDHFRATDGSARRIADGASWAVVGLVMAAPVGLAAQSASARNAPASAVGEALLGLVIPYASTALVGFGAKFLFARERPFATMEGLSRRCVRGDEAGCDPERNASFPSLHSALGFVGAGMLCAQSLRFAPNGNALDGVPCALGTFGASVGATLRMVADRHYATDVIAGSLLGLALSLGLGWALHHADTAPLALARSLDAPRTDALPVVLGGLAGVLGGTLTVAMISRQLN
jgi:membrane-associated phospholipid phosphatase